MKISVVLIKGRVLLMEVRVILNDGNRMALWMVGWYGGKCGLYRG